MTGETTAVEDSRRVSARQGRFICYMLYVLVDLTVLNLFVEYWDRVVIDSFTISLFTAVLLQVLLKATQAIEHRIGHHFQSRPGTGAVILQVVATWAAPSSSFLRPSTSSSVTTWTSAAWCRSSS